MESLTMNACCNVGLIERLGGNRMPSYIGQALILMARGG